MQGNNVFYFTFEREKKEIMVWSKPLEKDYMEIVFPDGQRAVRQKS